MAQIDDHATERARVFKDGATFQAMGDSAFLLRIVDCVVAQVAEQQVITGSAYHHIVAVAAADRVFLRGAKCEVIVIRQNDILDACQACDLAE